MKSVSPFLIVPNKDIPILHFSKRGFINGGSIHCPWLKPTAIEEITQIPFVLFQLALWHALMQSLWLVC